MNPRIQHLINNPFEVQLSDVALLQDEIEKYPYFSTLRMLLLFGLKEYDHSSYQDELKKTSIYSPSRVALYHYLQKEKRLPETEAGSEEIIAEQPSDASVENTAKQSAGTEEAPALDVAHSEFTFSEWLSLSKSSFQKENTPTEKDIKFQLIDEFIEKSPKISPAGRTQEIPPSIKRHEAANEYSDLMTETLAQIYTEQKKYDKAIRAYKILSLKYPEKDDFFAGKISEIENLKNS